MWKKCKRRFKCIIDKTDKETIKVKIAKIKNGGAKILRMNLDNLNTNNSTVNPDSVTVSHHKELIQTETQ
ncbi:hypothetical protein ACVQ9Z_08785 [Staphylococcus aureus]